LAIDRFLSAVALNIQAHSFGWITVIQVNQCRTFFEASPIIFIEQLIDQIIHQFEDERSIIFNQKKDLLLVDCQYQSKIEAVDVVMAFLRPEGQLHKDGQTVKMVLMTEKMYSEMVMKRRTPESYIASVVSARKLAMPVTEETKVNEKVSSIFDKRDTDYFIKLLQRREEAVSEYATV